MKFISDLRRKKKEQQLISLLIENLILKIIESKKISSVSEEVILLKWLLKRERYK